MSLFETDLLESQIVDAAPGEWTQVDMINSFYDVAVTKTEHDQMVAEGSEPFWGWGGVDIVFRSWNSSAYDPVGNVMYFTGGGRTNYGGNEVYSFDFDTLEWSRVTDPSPLTLKDFDDPDVSEAKRRKLVWAERLLYWLEQRRGERLDVLEGRREGIDTSGLPL